MIPPCLKCGEERVRAGKNHYRCRRCDREYKRLHPQKPRPEYVKQYKELNKERIKDYMHTYNMTVRKTNKESDGNRITFLGRDTRLSIRRTGVCNLCRAVKGIDCNYTNFHHTYYDETNPEAGIIELCRKCHNYESINMKQINRNKETGRFD